MSSTSEMQNFIAAFEGRLAPVEKATSEAWWNLATNGTPEAQKALTEAGIAYNNLFSDEREFEMVRDWHQGSDGLEAGSLVGRQVEVLYRMFAGHNGDAETLDRIQELEAAANATYNNHRGVVRGREVGENGIREILATSDDADLRQEAWEASKTVGREVESTVRELARLRNRLAQDAGYPDHFHHSLDLQDIEFTDLEEIMSDLEKATDEPFARLKSHLDAELGERFGVANVMPWHFSDPFFQSCKGDGAGGDTDDFFREADIDALTRRTYDTLGLEVRDVFSRSDLREREGKSQHAFCLGVGRNFPYDVRVLANVRPDSYWMDTMLHEFGHAVYDKHINPQLPYLLRTYAHLCVTEGIALMVGALAEDTGWLSKTAKFPESELERIQPEILQRARWDRLVFIRWALVIFHFEKALYADPERADLNDVWWDLVERIQLVKRPPERDEPDWAAKIHVAVAPVYYHNYVLGHLIATQLREYVETNITHGPFHQSEVAGRYLLEAVFGPGARDNWRDTVLRATGEPLNPKYFVDSLQ